MYSYISANIRNKSRITVIITAIYQLIVFLRVHFYILQYAKLEQNKYFQGEMKINFYV